MLVGEKGLAGNGEVAFALMLLSRPYNRYPVPTLHQPLAKLPERVCHAIDFRRKSLRNNGNVL